MQIARDAAGEGLMIVQNIIGGYMYLRSLIQGQVLVIWVTASRMSLQQATRHKEEATGWDRACLQKAQTLLLSRSCGSYSPYAIISKTHAVLYKIIVGKVGR